MNPSPILACGPNFNPLTLLIYALVMTRAIVAVPVFISGAILLFAGKPGPGLVLIIGSIVLGAALLFSPHRGFC